MKPYNQEKAEISVNNARLLSRGNAKKIITKGL